MKHLFLALSMAVTIFTLPADAADKFESTVTSDYRTKQGSWEGNGDVYIRWKPVNIDGKLAICGMFSTKGRSHFVAFNRQLLQKSFIVVDGTRVMGGFSYFKTHSNGRRNTSHVNDLTRCKVSRVAFPGPQADIRLIFKHGPYRIKR